MASPLSNPWLAPEIAVAQRQLVDRQLAESPPPVHFRALADAVRATNCPGSILEAGCGVGHGREILDRAGVPYRSYSGIDISPAMCALAKERYPESSWTTAPTEAIGRAHADVVIDGSCLLHVEDWRAHLAALCRASRRWVILHRIPTAEGGQEATRREDTQGYGQTFPAWRFGASDVGDVMHSHGFQFAGAFDADGGSQTVTFCKPRHWATYCDRAYLPRLRALHVSMKRHCGPFVLHVLAWDEETAAWCLINGVEYRYVAWFVAERPELHRDNLPGQPRSDVEYMWTVGPAWIADVMERTGEPVTYVDADVMFFSSPEPMFAEIGGAPAAVVPHNFAPASAGLPGPTRETHGRFGEYNVGIVHVRDIEFARRWARECQAWCYDRTESLNHKRSVYGDQKYLDTWDIMGAHVIQHPGACAGPWQIHTKAIDVRDGVIHFGNRQLISYHFSALKLGPHGYDSLSRPEYQLTERQEEILYKPYLAALKEAM